MRLDTKFANWLNSRAPNPYWVSTQLVAPPACWLSRFGSSSRYVDVFPSFLSIHIMYLTNCIVRAVLVCLGPACTAHYNDNQSVATSQNSSVQDNTCINYPDLMHAQRLK